uniref:Uncharacterized protein n=1 Tax=Anguilla anguilla TaxID=7936 RepID=A0A0E9VMG3_ANGAN
MHSFVKKTDHLEMLCISFDI